MANVPVAELMRGRDAYGEFGGPAQVRVLVNGLQGTRHYKINCGDESLALAASGLPAMNDPWQGGTSGGPLILTGGTFDLTRLIVQSITIQRVGGRDSATTQTGAWSWAQVDYSTPTFRITKPPGVVGLRYVRQMPGTTTIQRNVDIRYDTDPSPANSTPINGDQGMTVTVGQMRLEVTVYPYTNELTGPSYRSRLFALHANQNLNDTNVLLPPLLGEGETMSFTAEQLQFAGYNSDPDGELRRVVYQLNASPNFDYKWYQKDKFGVPILGFNSKGYAKASFGGLW